jgi:hypothetical protein
MRRFHRVLAVAAFGAAVTGLIASPAAAAHDYDAAPDLFDHHSTTPGDGWAPGDSPGTGVQAGEDHFPYDHIPYDQPPGQGWIQVP